MALLLAFGLQGVTAGQAVESWRVLALPPAAAGDQRGEVGSGVTAGQTAAASLGIDLSASSSSVQNGDILTLTFSLSNTAAVTTVHFFAPIPQGLVYEAVVGASPITTPLASQTDPAIKSITATLSLTDTYLITLTTTVTRPGSQPDGDILVQGLLSNFKGEFLNFTSTVIGYIWNDQLYLPLIVRTA
jgi:hypothetical protein